jgi:hypothetical protein
LGTCPCIVKQPGCPGRNAIDKYTDKAPKSQIT